MKSTMMSTGLSLNHLLERAGNFFSSNTIVSRLPDKSFTRHTYGEWYSRTRSLASALHKAGITKGDRVATLCWNHHVHLEAYFGVPAAGAVLHALNIRLSPEELGWIAADGGARTLIVDDVLLPLYQRFAHLHSFERVLVFGSAGVDVDSSVESYDDFLATGDAQAFEYLPHDENDPVGVCYTSGTTGNPKGVVYSHRSTVLHTLMICLPDHMGLKGSDCVLPVTPMFHANCWGLPFAAVMMGAKMVFPGQHLAPDDLLDVMQLEQPTLSLGVPTIWMSVMEKYESALVNEPGRWLLPQGMRSLVGGSALPESLIRAFDKHGVWLKQGWGMTETSPLATVSYPRAELDQASADECYRRAAMAGTPVPLVEMRLQGDDAENIPWDGKTTGEIQVRGPFVTGSYHNAEAADDKFTADGWLRTGDVGVLDELGFLRLTDRSKDLIKSGGEWISSVDMENALMAHPSIAEAAIIAIPDAKWGERPLACLVLKPGAEVSEAELARHLVESHGFAKWQVPDRFEYLEEVPRTSTGKFWKARLRDLFPA